MAVVMATTAAELSADIEAIDLDSQAGDGGGAQYRIELAAGVTLTEAADINAVNLKGADSLTLEGDGAILDGANAHRGLFVYQGAVTINNLTIQNAVAKGGAGGAGAQLGGGGGGGAGFGGGLFLANDAAHGAGPARVTLNAVTFNSDSAVGGDGGAVLGGYGGDGGGMGGAGGNFRGGGGGIDGAGGLGWPSFDHPNIIPPQPGLVPGAASGGHGGAGAGGANGGGGAAANAFALANGSYDHVGGGGGGIGGGAGNASGDLSHFIGGDGGFGGGGGWAGGKGGFGGGGAATRPVGLYNPAGRGGFGGGGGGNLLGVGAGGGFGAGAARIGGGGGLGAGGAIFIMQGASLTMEGGAINGGSVAGGAGGGGGAAGSEGDAGQAFGGGIFLQGDESVTLAPAAGTVETITGVIADQTGSGGAGADAGAGRLVIDGAGTVDLAAANTFTGGVEIDRGTLELGNAASENISLPQATGSLVLDQPKGFSGTISTGAAVGSQYTLLLQGVFYSSVTSYAYSAGVLAIATTQGDFAYNFTGSYQTSDFSLSAAAQPLSKIPSLQISLTPGAVHANKVDVDTSADLKALTAAQIADLAAQGFTELAASDNSLRYSFAQSAAIQAAGLAVSAPANDLVREDFADGSSRVWLFDADDAISLLKTINADGGFERERVNIQGASYTAFQSDFTSAGALAARSFDLDDRSGTVRMFGSGLQIDAVAGNLGPSSDPGDFTFTPHAREAFVFLHGASDDVVSFGPGFGDDVVRGFTAGASNDVVNVSGLFADFAAAQSAMTQIGPNTLMTDARGDTLRLVGVAAGSLTASELGFA